MSHCLLFVAGWLFALGLLSWKFPAAAHPGALIGYSVAAAASAWAFSFLHVVAR